MTIKGRPDLLEAYTEATSRSIPALAEAIDRYEVAVRTFNQARNDLRTRAVDHAPDAWNLCSALIELDAEPSIFAQALRQLDTQHATDPTRPGQGDPDRRADRVRTVLNENQAVEPAREAGRSRPIEQRR